MKKLLVSIGLILFFTPESNSHVDHYKKYNYLEYELFRNNQLIGHHKYSFFRNNGNLKIENEVSFKINKHGIDLYQYYATGEEYYNNGVFSGFNSKTNQNKKEKYVNIKIDPNDKNLIIDGSSYKGKADKDIIIGTWWNHEIVQKKAQISAVSGRIIEQKVEFIGKEDIKIEYSRDNYFSELKESELLKERIQTLDMIQPHVGEYFTKEWVMKNVLKLSEEETKDLDQEVDDENQDEVDKAQDNAPEKVDKDSDEA